jgi:hypothetical protein
MRRLALLLVSWFAFPAAAQYPARSVTLQRIGLLRR